MARLEDFLDEARAETHALLEDIADRGGTIVRDRTGRATGDMRAKQFEQAAFEDSVRLGLRGAMSGARDALTCTSEGRGDAAALPGLLRHTEKRTDQSSRGIVPNPRLERIGVCFSAVADLAAEMAAADEKRRVHDHVATTVAHLARASAATQTRANVHVESTRDALTRLARDLDTQRSTPAPHDLGEEGMKGVPDTPLEQSLHRWRALSHEVLTPSRLAAGAKTAAEVARSAAQVSAASYRACLTQEGPAAKDRAQRWSTLAKAWQEAAEAWQPPPFLVSGQHRPNAEVLAASHDLKQRIAGDFRDANLVWVPPERLADPEGLRRFEYDARQAMVTLGERYHSAVGSLARSEVIAIPKSQLGRLEGDRGLDPEKRLGSKPWTTLPASDPSARRLADSAAHVEAASLNLNRPGPSVASGPLDRPQRESTRSSAVPARDLNAHRGPGQGPGRE